MLRDRQSNETIGYGISQYDLPFQDVQEVDDPNSGAIAKAVNGNPVKKYFAAAAATIVGASVASAMARGVGKKALSKLARTAAHQKSQGLNTGAVRALDSFREVQNIMDEYGGVIKRARGSSIDERFGSRVAFDDPTKDKFTIGRGFDFTQGEREQIRAAGGDPSGVKWTYSDEIQQRMVRAARRLPYELPAAYVTQRLISDPLLGIETGGQDVNWMNPVDVIGDFALQSVKNLAFAFGPYEAGVGSAAHGWRKAMTEASELGMDATLSKRQELFVGLHASLGRLGHESADVIARSVKFSRNSTGALATASTDAAGRQKSIFDHMEQIKGQGFTKWTNSVLRGEEKISPLGYASSLVERFKHRQNLSDVIDDTYKLKGTRLEDLSPEGTFAGGKYVSHFLNDSYRNMLARNLIDDGAPEAVARRFTQEFSFSLPQSAKSQTHISKRIFAGDKEIFEGADNWTTALNDRIKPLFKNDTDSITKNIRQAMSRADREYTAERPFLLSKASKQWSQVYRGPVTAHAKMHLGMRKAAYSEFDGNISAQSREFLVRRSAERLGIQTVSSGGVRRSTSDLYGSIRGRGLDPANQYQLRSYLVNQGDISKSWNPLGLNVFGLRSLSVQEAINRRGVFDFDTPVGKEIRSLTDQIQRSDFDKNILDRLKVGGMYRAGDKIVNFNPIRQSMRNAMDVLANETKIPLIQLNPMTLMGYGVRQEINNQSMIQIAGSSSSPFIPAGERGAGTLMWFRSGRAKGRVARLDVDDQGRVSHDFLNGSYRPLPTSADTMSGRSVRHAIGDTGRRAFEPRTGIKGILDLDEYQPNSIPSLIQRFKNRRENPNNVGAFIRRMLDNAQMSPVERAEGIDSLVSNFRNSSFTHNFIQNLPDESALKRLFSTGTRAGVHDLDAPALYGRILAAGDDSLLEGLPRGQREMVQRAKRNLLGPWQRLDSSDVLNQPLTKPQRTLGLHRRIDAARMDYIRYRSIEDYALSGGTNFREYVNTLLEEVGTMQGKGVLSSREAAENRAALGSLYATFASMTKYLPGDSKQDTAGKIADMLMGQNPIRVQDQMREMFEEAARYGRTGKILGRVREKLGPGQYEYTEGFAFNPFGDRVTFTPTFGTAFDRNPVRATLSASGATTWSDPEAFSGSGIASSHLFDRMNRAIGVMGLGIDQTTYSGPLSLFSKGMMGKRALPIFGAGATFMAADRTLGAYVGGDTDADGNRIYSPFFGGMAAKGIAEAQITLSGATPGGLTAEEKRHQLYEGEVAIRRGRFWPIGSSEFRGDKIEYYRPSWYRRFMSGYQYSDQTFGSPMERLAFGYDFSPLRPLDPYRFERQNYDTRPYPVTGDYFTGPWGPMTGVLNQTVGRILKPRRMMHEGEVNQALASYQPVGMSGMAPVIGGGGPPSGVASVGDYQAAVGTPAYISGSAAVPGQLGQINQQYLDAAYGTGIYNPTSNYPFGVEFGAASTGSPASPRMPNNVVAAQPFTTQGSLGYQMSETAWRFQEWFGIYGFGFGAARETLGFGNMDFRSQQPVLASASEAYGISRQFWDWNIGGMGDLPTPLEGEYANLELSEIVRRFIPKPRRGNMVNPIMNQMGRENSFLPSDPYFIDFHRGDPFCLSGDTIVEVGDLDFAYARDIKEGDRLVSAKGSETKVIRTAIRDVDKTLKITLSENPAYPITSTTDHPFLKRTIKSRTGLAKVRRYRDANLLLEAAKLGGTKYTMWRRVKLTDAQKRVAWKLLEEENKVICNDNRNVTILDGELYDEDFLSSGKLVFTKAEDLREGDYVAYPKPQIHGDIDRIDLSNLGPWSAVTEEFVYYRGGQSYCENREFLCGEREEPGDVKSLYDARGNLKKGNKPSRYNRFVDLDFDFGKFVGLWCAEGSADDDGQISTSHHILEVEDVKTIYKNAGIRYSNISGEENDAQFVHGCKGLSFLLRALCGSGAKTKRLHEDFLHFPQEFLEGFIEGLFFGDGWYSETGNKISNGWGTSSKILALQVRKILLALGIVSSFGRKPPRENVIIKGRLTRAAESWTLNIYGDGSDFYRKWWFSDDKFFFFRVQSIEEASDQETFGFMTDSATFCAVGVATHNTKIPFGEGRLPGTGYRRFNELNPDEFGEYGLLDRFKILADTCVHPETLIRLADNSVKKAFEVEEGDLLISHTGEHRRVERCAVRPYSPNLIELSVAFIPAQKLLATPEHPIYIIRRERVDRRLTEFRHLPKGLTKEERRLLEYSPNNASWVPLGEVRKDDVVVYPIPKRNPLSIRDYISVDDFLDSEEEAYTKREDGWIHLRKKGSNIFCINEIALDEEFWFVAGLYLAEGCVSRNNGCPKEITFSLRLDSETHLAERVHSYFSAICDNSIQIKEKVETNSLYVTISNQILARVFGYLFGCNSYNKKIPDFFFNESPSRQRKLLQSAFEGDGSISFTPSAGHAGQLEMNCTSVSLTLLLGIRDALLQNGFVSSLALDNNKTGFTSTTQKYRIRITGTDAQDLHFWLTGEVFGPEIEERLRRAWIKDGFLLSFVDRVENVPYEGSVFNWTVEVDNSFCVLGYVTHNSPYARQTEQLQKQLLSSNLNAEEQLQLQRAITKMESVKQKEEFEPYEHKYDSPLSPAAMMERFAHADTFFHSKFYRNRTAVEDWERSNVYGATFSSWSSPIESFIDPAMNRARDRNPLIAAASMGILGGMFGSTSRAKAVGRFVGATAGFGLSATSNLREMITGERFVPPKRKHELAVEEQVDILEYTRALRGFNLAQDAGDAGLANQFRRQMKSTLYGADIYGATQEELAMAVPKRKREHFAAMINAPEQERERILSTAGRLERRIYQAAWGMRVERRPELTDYFTEHELPPPGSDVWDPRTSMEAIEIKMLQQQGLTASEMGYYPQQVEQANLLNPDYPMFGQSRTQTPSEVRTELMRLMSSRGMSGDVRMLPSVFPGYQVSVDSGVF